MGKVDLVRLTEPKLLMQTVGITCQQLLKTSKLDGPDAYTKSCACEYRDMALTKVCIN
jgi:glycine betaine/proline transport system substrate-binding protein